MEKKTLVKDGVRKVFLSEIAVKIAIEHLGWSEETVFARPSELLSKTFRPVPLIVPPVKTENYPSEVKAEPIPEVVEKVSEPVIEAKVKKTRTRSKSTK